MRPSSLDSYRATSDAFIASGNRRPGPLSIYWEMLGHMVSCFVEDAIRGKSDITSLYTTFMQTNMNRPDPLDGFEPFVVDTLDKQQVCGRQSLQE